MHDDDRQRRRQWWGCVWWPAGDDKDDDKAQQLHPSPSHAHAIADVLPQFLAFLDHASLRGLSSTCRGARGSIVRERFLGASELTVHVSPVDDAASNEGFGRLRRLALRRHLGAISLSGWHVGPTDVPQLRELLAHVRSVTMVANYDHEAIERDLRRHEQQRRREQDHDEHADADAVGLSRRVRPRVQEEQQPVAEDFAMRTLQWLEAWLEVLPPDLDALQLGETPLPSWRWLGRFPCLKRLQALGLELEPTPGDVWRPLAALSALESASLGGDVPAEAIEPLITPRRFLTALSIRSDCLANVDFLIRLSMLTRLVLVELAQDVRGLAAVYGLTNLEELVLGSNPGPLRLPPIPNGTTSFPRLRSLELMAVETAFPRLLRRTPRLRLLSLEECRITDLAALAGLQELEDLTISMEGIPDWSGLAGLPRLRELVLEEQRDGPIDGTRYFGPGWPALEELTSPEWRDFEPLVRHAPRLRRLCLFGACASAPTALTALALAPRLRALDLQATSGLTDLSAVGGLTQLTQLSVSGANGRSIEFLRPLQRLEELHLSDQFAHQHAIEDFTPLLALRSLRILSLRARMDFTEKELQLLDQLPALEEADVSWTAAAGTLTRGVHPCGRFVLVVNGGSKKPGL